jgi:cell division protein ZapE
VFITGVPVLTAAKDDAARRFISVVDEFYDRGVKLVVSAAAGPGELYRGERLAFDFRRTASRLTEMQSEEYLARPHLKSMD